MSRKMNRLPAWKRRPRLKLDGTLADEERAKIDPEFRKAQMRGGSVWWSETADPDYRHAPAAALERWWDRRFGMRIHWGLYSMLGLRSVGLTNSASTDYIERYRILHQVFNPCEFDAEAWAGLAERAGMKYFVFTTKHQDGFSLYPTRTRRWALRYAPRSRDLIPLERCRIAYSVMDTRYPVDIVGELVKAFRRRGMGVGLYYCHGELHDPDFRFIKGHYEYDPAYTIESEPAGFARAVARQRAALRELCTWYGEIDELDFDGGLPQCLWPELVKMVKMIRRLQPEVLIRHRGIGPYGDFQSPEYWIPDGPDDDRIVKPWQAIDQLGTGWTWQPNDNYRPGEWVIDTLIECASKGGNFMLGVGPMGSGRFDEPTVERLKYAGDWLAVNGEAIYATRPWRVAGERQKAVRFTRSKDERTVYAIHTGWPGRRAAIRSLRAAEGSKVAMLGVPGHLNWTNTDKALLIDLPAALANHPPCKQAFVFKITPRPVD